MLWTKRQSKRKNSVTMAKEGALGRLAKDTAWYGLSTILGRLINWLLVPFYVRVLATTGEYGVCLLYTSDAADE